MNGGLIMLQGWAQEIKNKIENPEVYRLSKESTRSIRLVKPVTPQKYTFRSNAFETDILNWDFKPEDRFDENDWFDNQDWSGRPDELDKTLDEVFGHRSDPKLDTYDKNYELYIKMPNGQIVRPHIWEEFKDCLEREDSDDEYLNWIETVGKLFCDFIITNLELRTLKKCREIREKRYEIMNINRELIKTENHYRTSWMKDNQKTLIT